MINKLTQLGFTLIEMLVVVLIIGILGAIMLPQYQRAVLKSRYSGMMPIAKALAEGNEVFFLEHGHYSENPADLMIAGRDKNAGAYPDGTRVLMYDDDGLSYVRVMNDNVPNARYLVYQKHSENFADTTQCEAADERANELCQALGGQLIEEGNSSGEAGWTAYVLSGNYGSGDSFAEAGTGNNDDPGAGTGTGDEPEPQTPSKPTCGGVEQPDDIAPTETNPATGTATCVNGQWKYQWTGGKVYDTDYTDWKTVCTGNSAYKCAGSEFKGNYNQCDATQEGGCAGSTFSGKWSYCRGTAANACADSSFSGYGSGCTGNAANGCARSTFTSGGCTGYVANGCADSTFSGSGSICTGHAANACAGSTFSGEDSRCNGQAANGCAGTIIQAGATCIGWSSGGCDGVKYGTNPDHTGSGANMLGSCNDYQGNCPNGVPLRGDWNYTTQAYDISSWKGGYCDPNAMVTGKCPAGTHSADANGTLDGQCWDGNGNRIACS